MPKHISIADFLTEAEIEQAITIYKTAAPGTFARLVAEQIITPNMARINKALGQENDSRYLAYAVEHVLNQAVIR